MMKTSTTGGGIELHETNRVSESSKKRKKKKVKFDKAQTPLDAGTEKKKKKKFIWRHYFSPFHTIFLFCFDKLLEQCSCLGCVATVCAISTVFCRQYPKNPLGAIEVCTQCFFFFLLPFCFLFFFAKIFFFFWGNGFFSESIKKHGFFSGINFLVGVAFFSRFFSSKKERITMSTFFFFFQSEAKLKRFLTTVF